MFVSLKKYFFRTFSILFFAAAIFFFIHSIQEIFLTLSFLSKAEKTTGEVIENIEEKRTYLPRHRLKIETYTSYRPIFAVKSPSGETLKIPSDFSSYPAEYKLGDQTDLYIIYVPLRAVENSFLGKGHKIISFGIATLGLLFSAWAFW